MRPAVPLAVAAGAIAVVVIAFASQPEEVETTTTQPLVVADPDTMVATTTTRAVPSTSEAGSGMGLGEHLPETEGELVTVITMGDGRYSLNFWPHDRPVVSSEMPPMLNRPILSFDAADMRLAFLGPTSVPEGHPLYVGRQRQWLLWTGRVTSFAWHASRPGRLAWVEFGRGLCQADVDLDGSMIGEPSCITGVTGELVALDRYGTLVVDGEEVVRLDVTGEELARTRGDDALVAPDGRVLVVDRDTSGAQVTFHLADPLLGEVVHLEWAPGNATGEYGFVSWSPHATEPQLAFLVAEEGRYQIQRWGLDGALLNSLNLGGRLWDIKWDRSGRYLLAPGVSDGAHVVYLYDLFTLEIAAVPFSDWVQDAHMINAAECEEASSLTIAWQNRLPEGVAVDDLWMVLSRDSSLVSWRFLSGRIFGGPHDREIATWAIPVYSGAGAPPRAVPANEAAIDPGRAPSPLDQNAYGVDNWMDIDGARISQWCVEAFGG